MAAAVGDRRFLPHLMRHEFEALVLAAIDQLAAVLDGRSQRQGLEALRKGLGIEHPEDVDDGPDTAPSKRLQHHVEGYRKLTHGVPAVQAAGMPALRRVCPRFDAWVRSLEVLAGSSGA
jgi:Domain of unknown function (DUF4276)